MTFYDLIEFALCFYPSSLILFMTKRPRIPQDNTSLMQPSHLSVESLTPYCVSPALKPLFCCLLQFSNFLLKIPTPGMENQTTPPRAMSEITLPSLVTLPPVPQAQFHEVQTIPGGCTALLGCLRPHLVAQKTSSLDWPQQIQISLGKCPVTVFNHLIIFLRHPALLLAVLMPLFSHHCAKFGESRSWCQSLRHSEKPYPSDSIPLWLTGTKTHNESQDWGF